jgi:hypothetical protein
LYLFFTESEASLALLCKASAARCEKYIGKAV